jgi:hypothetical protein
MSPSDSGDISKEVPDHVIDTLARCLLPKIQAYFDSPEGQADFEAWKGEQEGS